MTEPMAQARNKNENLKRFWAEEPHRAVFFLAKMCYLCRSTRRSSGRCDDDKENKKKCIGFR